MNEKSASRQIDMIIKTHDDWRGDVLSQLRTIIAQTDSSITEEIKWQTPSRPEGLPVWTHNGILCIAETWKDNIKLIFFKGALLQDPNNLFNARLKSRSDRAIEFREGDSIDKDALENLVREAIRLRQSQ